MLVRSWEEVTEADGKKETHAEYDTMRLGIATQGPYMLGLESQLLGSTLEAHLAKHHLLA